MTRASRLALVSTLLVACAVGCAKKEDVVVHASEGQKLAPPAIDADPLALLPPNAIGAGTLDARALFASRFGARLLEIVRARAPFPAAAGIEPGRDLERVYFGVYSMQGADFAGVALGTFQPDAIAALDGELLTTGSFPVTKSEYAGRTVFMSRGLGFTVLTARTIVFGTEAGLRRALDRLESGRVERRLPKWMIERIEAPSAPLVFGADFTAHPVPDAARRELPFLDGVSTLGLVGNFEEPGLNAAGTLTYDTPEAAGRGAAQVGDLSARLGTYAPLLALVGITQPVRKLEAEAVDDEVRFVLGIDGAAVARLLDLVQAYPAAGAPGAAR
ncbi:MAG TPA: hypothetical protein VKY73_11325 [Polyangiaceae bacterium]|nr:hypothetical protein [Polyangiaceae bacterium]